MIRFAAGFPNGISGSIQPVFRGDRRAW